MAAGAAKGCQRRFQVAPGLRRALHLAQVGQGDDAAQRRAVAAGHAFSAHGHGQRAVCIVHIRGHLGHGPFAAPGLVAQAVDDLAHVHAVGKEPGHWGAGHGRRHVHAAQVVEGGVGKDQRAFGVGQQHRFARRAHGGAHLRQLVFSDQQTHRVHLHDDVHECAANGPRHHAFGVGPGQRGAAHDLAPGGERAARRQLQRVVVHHRLGRVAGPGDAVELLFAKPHQVVGSRAGQLHRHHTAGGGCQQRQRRMQLAHGRAGKRAVSRDF